MADRTIKPDSGNDVVIQNNGGSSKIVVPNSGNIAITGHIIQIQFKGFDSDQSIGNGSSTGTTFVNVGSGVSGEEFSISMAVSSGNKIIGFGNVNISANKRYSALKVFMDSTQIACGTETGSSRANVSVSGMGNPDNTNDQYIMNNSSFSFNYSPSDTSSHTYTVKAGNTNEADAYTLINRPFNNDNSAYVHRGYSSFILMEVQQ
jgi:hypothetical protein